MSLELLYVPIFNTYYMSNYATGMSISPLFNYAPSI